MMTNLFSIFDPSTSTMSMAWAMILSPLLMKQSTTKKNHGQMEYTKKALMVSLMKEINQATSGPKKGLSSMILSIFFTILLMNLYAVYPFVFSTTSQISLNLPMALMAWTSIMMMGWINNTKHMLSHMVPQGTPLTLMNFMVLIELVSNMIRPITLCVRLTANMVAGHLLLSLLGSFVLSTSKSGMIMMSTAPLILCSLESAVALIQAYVFMTLVTLYSTEIS